MIKKYIVERFSWIIFYILLHLFIIFVAFIDTAIPLKPILYIVFLSMIMFSIFLIVRYKIETKFYKSLEDREDNLDLTNIADPDSPFERIIENSIMNQTEFLKQSASQGQMTLEQEKDELLSWIHEVKTPLTAMHLMIDRLDDEMLKSHLTYEWLRIHLLLDQQLHQRRIPFIENDLYIENTDLETIIFDEIKTLQSWCIQKGIGFDIHLEVTEVLSDAKWLAFIMRQLLTNSIKYSENSDITIYSHEQAEQTILEVKDSGRGIDPKDLSRIFDKGFTSTTNHRDNAATGMGLYLTKNAAESLFISIDVKSELGTGTTVTLSFPKRNDFVNITSM
ncbi:MULTISPECIES: sensor histidine kinase [unclassified Peribacillus]|uniref:sensor histidine kinase n=1 Tax=unclassified Peribacillus TaxID=2675266 RepID=UPI001911ADC9|nr:MULTISPECIES: sensor histidine kinase [unclassified Peribacillus]MBK5443037.1 sensor histidine kinase [Peribacillus sp. TH24]MBK5462223.1 sensor histidine kinase [Peribacillus sp. TH27]MBK5484439.1 sensor histidine kinase [Peribacillus sp. TH16]MBK5500375.1 sensor histidine kinase [Peribacillus sp. TH14]WMX54592.1 sensor histidine kinase [Peribacillus sp. R9-11]